MDPLDVLNESKCYNCKHRLSRIVKPLTQEDKEYYMDVLDIDNVDDYELYLEQHKCLLTDEDIDGIIQECNRYEPIVTNRLIGEYKF